MGGLPEPKDNSVALITGASSGIGVDIARELAKRGHALALVARRREQLDDVAKGLTDEFGVTAHVVPADLTDAAARSAVRDQIDELGLLVDILVNNAGFTTMGPVFKADRDKEMAMIRTNVEAVVDMCALFAPPMATRRRGAILNTASTAAFQPLPGQAGYGATKAFVLSYSRAIRTELEPLGITVTALCPGPVETGFGEVAGLNDDEAGNALPKIMWVSPAEVARAAVAGLAAGRSVVIPGSANRIAASAAHLAPKGLVSKLVAKKHPALRGL